MYIVYILCTVIHLLVLCSQDVCRKPQQVCGHNGETYNTVCDAFSDRVAVDYEGPCHAVGPVSDVAPESACSMIPCPPLSTPGCRPVTPPGECTADHDHKTVTPYDVHTVFLVVVLK